MSTTRHVSREKASSAFVQLMPHIIRGVALDFFVKRGVTQTQFLVLMAIHAYGCCTMGALARSMHVRMPTATGVVDRLVQVGFVRRSPRAEDRRQVFVELTEKGKAFIRQFHEVVRRRWEDVLRSLDPGELEAFYRILTKLRERLESHP